MNGIGNGSKRIGNRNKGIGRDGKEEENVADIRARELFLEIRQMRIQVRTPVPPAAWDTVQKVFLRKILSMRPPSWAAYIKIFCQKILRVEISPYSWAVLKLISARQTFRVRLPWISHRSWEEPKSLFPHIGK